MRWLAASPFKSGHGGMIKVNRELHIKWLNDMPIKSIVIDKDDVAWQKWKDAWRSITYMDTGLIYSSTEMFDRGMFPIIVVWLGQKNSPRPETVEGVCGRCGQPEL